MTPLTRLLRLVGESGLTEHGKELKEMFSGLSRSMNNMDFGGMNQQVQMLSAMSRTMRPAASTLSRVFSTDTGDREVRQNLGGEPVEALRTARIIRSMPALTDIRI